VLWSLLALAVGCGARPLRVPGGSDGGAGAARVGRGAAGDGAGAGQTGAAGDTAGGAAGAPAATGGASAGDDCNGIELYGLTAGDSCFDIQSVAAGASDGCDLGVAEAAPAGPVGAALPVHYDPVTGTVTIGSTAVLGSGAVRCNVGTLSHDVTPVVDTLPPCSWHQVDTSTIQLTSNNELDIAVTEVEDMFEGCSAATTPAGGRCVSTWTWHLRKGFESPPSCQ
jgi:hypothetical protein